MKTRSTSRDRDDKDIGSGQKAEGTEGGIIQKRRMKCGELKNRGSKEV